ncbi:hypothetical protein Ddc_17097 [Ditylenchus destructor]|nr:hypothetical protein Ddc_17097 [Ditylenchus destructor]
MVSKQSTFLLSVFFLSFFAPNEIHAGDGQNPNDMSSIDLFTTKISEVMNSNGDGKTKFKELSKTFAPLMGIAEQVAGNIPKLYNTTDKHDLTIAAEKLYAIYEKLQKYKTVKESDAQDPRPTQYLTVDMERENAFISNNIIEVINVPINVMDGTVAVALESNLTLLVAVACHDATYSPFKIAINLEVFASDIATVEIRKYGPSAVDNVYGEFHDVILKLSFFHTICFAGAKVSGKMSYAAADLGHVQYQRVMSRVINQTDSIIEKVLDDTKPRTIEAAGR